MAGKCNNQRATTVVTIPERERWQTQGMAGIGAARQRGLAVSAVVFTICLAAALAAILAVGELGRSASEVPVLSSGSDLVMAFAFVLVGLFVALKRPGNLVGWALVLSGIGLLGGAVLASYARLALLARPDLGLRGGVAAAAVGSGSWVPLMAGVFVLFLVFPSGRVPSPRAGRFAVWVLAGFALVWALIATAPDRLEEPLAGYGNSLAFVQSDWYLRLAYPVMFACLASIAAAGVMAFRRFRRSRGVERQQFKWPIAVVSLLVLTMPVAGVSSWTATAGAVFGLELIALPVSVGIAVLRYRLYEIDRLISRTLVYGSLTRRARRRVRRARAGRAGACSPRSPAARTSRSRSRRSSWRRSSCPPRTRVQGSSTGASTGAATTRGARSRRSARGSASRSSSTCCSGDLEAVVRETMQPAHVSLWVR